MRRYLIPWKHFSFNDTREVPPAWLSYHLILKNNGLLGMTTWPPKEITFWCSSTPRFMGQSKKKLRLILCHTAMHCGIQLCWMKEGVEAGWLMAEFAVDQQVWKPLHRTLVWVCGPQLLRSSRRPQGHTQCSCNGSWSMFEGKYGVSSCAWDRQRTIKQWNTG